MGDSRGGQTVSTALTSWEAAWRRLPCAGTRRPRARRSCCYT